MLATCLKTVCAVSGWFCQANTATISRTGIRGSYRAYMDMREMGSKGLEGGSQRSGQRVTHVFSLKPWGIDGETQFMGGVQESYHMLQSESSWRRR